VSQDVVVLGLTGGIASGKSTVARLLEELGAVRIDTDMIAREVVRPGSAVLARLVDEFGSGIVGGDGALDRAALARVVFADDSARRRMEALVHPAVIAEMDRQIAELRAQPPRRPLVVVVEVPLLFEAGLAGRFDEILVVRAKQSDQEARLIGQRGLTAVEARQRIAAQLPTATKAARADAVIDNDGTIRTLTTAVRAYWRRRFPLLSPMVPRRPKAYPELQ
jgi:dephospho-CoA kinase